MSESQHDGNELNAAGNDTDSNVHSARDAYGNRVAGYRHRADGSPEVIKVFVRLGDGRDDVRRLSFQIPKASSYSGAQTAARGFTSRDLLDGGFAIDGNHATSVVTGWVEEDGSPDGTYHPLAEALLTEQRRLVKWFDERGFDVIFE